MPEADLFFLNPKEISMAALKGSKTEDNLKAAFAGESQANRRYLYFANRAATSF